MTPSSKQSGTLSGWLRGRMEKSREEKLDKLQRQEFLQELSRARRDLEVARQNYDYAKEPALLEYYIYEIKAAETRLDYYLKLAKRDRVTNEGYLSGLFVDPAGRREELS